MLFRLLILFTIVPFIELYLLIKLYQATSLLTTLLVIFGTAIVGVSLERVQGWLVWQKIQLDLQHGRLPADGLIEAIGLLAAGLLLITPGLLTDAVGFALLLPPCRAALRDWIKRKFHSMIENGQSRVFVVRGGTDSVEPDVVDVEYREVDGDSDDDE